MNGYYLMLVAIYKLAIKEDAQKIHTRIRRGLTAKGVDRNAAKEYINDNKDAIIRDMRYYISEEMRNYGGDTRKIQMLGMDAVAEKYITLYGGNDEKEKTDHAE